jgi:hypothetical protein
VSTEWHLPLLFLLGEDLSSHQLKKQVLQVLLQSALIELRLLWLGWWFQLEQLLFEYSHLLQVELL